MTKFLLIAVAAMFFVFNNNSYSQFNGCEERPCSNLACESCSLWSEWAERTKVIVYPQFPECHLVVAYCYRECLDFVDPGARCVELNVTVIQPVIDDFSCGRCKDFMAFIQTGDPFLDAIRMNEIFDYCWWKINMDDWNKFIGSGIPLDDLYCDEDINVDIYSRYKVSTSLETCVAYCYTQFPISDPKIPLLVTKIPCSESFCCVRTMGFCIDRMSGTTIWSEKKESYPPTDCTHSTVPLRDCPPGENVTVSPCFNSCD